jgi:large subunit ribosomal protein L6
MSRIGKLPVKIPEGVTIEINDDREIKAKGPKGELMFNFGYDIELKQEGDEIIVEKIGKTKQAAAFWGTTRAMVSNITQGVSVGFKKELELNGVGYRMAVQGKKVVLNLGYSHPVEKDIPEGLEIKIDKNILTVEGIDRQKVGQFAAEIREQRKVEPYKGKGFRYVDEHVIRKEGKRAVGTE